MITIEPDRRQVGEVTIICNLRRGKVRVEIKDRLDRSVLVI